jgi:hypothetical protein
MDLNAYLKGLQRLVTALKKLHAPKKPAGDDLLAESLNQAIDAEKALNLSELRRTLEHEVKEVRERLETSLDHRRETLLKAARNANLAHKRFGDFDRVGPFKVTYRGKKVSLELGSESVVDFEAVDGASILTTIQQRLTTLSAEPFSREEFFRILKDALRLARERGKDREGWVPVRLLYGYVALLRNLDFENFVKKPSPRNFRDYTSAQFVFDLARFGQDGWSCGDETLRAETTNMATVSAGKAMTLPSLNEIETLGHQLARLRIDKSGTDRDSGKAR